MLPVRSGLRPPRRQEPAQLESQSLKSSRNTPYMVLLYPSSKQVLSGSPQSEAVWMRCVAGARSPQALEVGSTAVARMQELPARRWAVHCSPAAAFVEAACGRQLLGGWGRKSISCFPSPLHIQNLKCSERALVSAST